MKKEIELEIREYEGRINTLIHNINLMNAQINGHKVRIRDLKKQEKGK